MPASRVGRSTESICASGDVWQAVRSSHYVIPGMAIGASSLSGTTSAASTTYPNADDRNYMFTRLARRTYDPGQAGGTRPRRELKRMTTCGFRVISKRESANLRASGCGVMIYWHVERGRLCVYSQLKSCSSSEVAAMIEGLLRHGTDAGIEANYTDTHGATIMWTSQVGRRSPACLGSSRASRG
jgi:Tn3 transposase DDE domain-containing protein